MTSWFSSSSIITSLRFCFAIIYQSELLQIGSEYAWLWVDIEPVHKQVIGEPISTYHFLELDTSFPLILKALPYPLQ